MIPSDRTGAGGGAPDRLGGVTDQGLGLQFFGRKVLLLDLPLSCYSSSSCCFRYRRAAGRRGPRKQADRKSPNDLEARRQARRRDRQSKRGKVGKHQFQTLCFLGSGEGPLLVSTGKEFRAAVQELQVHPTTMSPSCICLDHLREEPGRRRGFRSEEVGGSR